MKKWGWVLICITMLSSCGEEKSLLEQAVELKCECLKKFDKEKGNVMEVINCSNEIAAREEFSDLDPQKLVEALENTCPDAALPFEEMQQ